MAPRIPAGPLHERAFRAGFSVLGPLVAEPGLPEHAMSRVCSYDGLFSLVRAPLGAAVAGPAVVAFGTSATLWAMAVLEAVCVLALLAIPDVRRLRRVEGDAMPPPADTARLVA